MAEINERASVSIDCPLSPGFETGDEIRHTATESFTKMREYVNGQVQATVADYKLLEELNKTTEQRYLDMHQVAKNITGRLGDLTQKYDSLRPYLRQVDEVEAISKELETTVGVLEKYLNALETKFKMLQLSSPV
ncbi:unnamed protein product [Bursaphelenchus okinawaensis]|uniref:Biogenesis of lysosome-related organelles complex 1 subunit 2 n=1 Tax=Bursaphelenchus okinawaensis TaxID=465554 RepID=A0A811KVM7_9BILA|nr:unnamed protein product [Bursaphelenchus okinawaensis]CAG9112703.1 unnamed protein product [Bursaphelenchus okinawaensis]